MSQNNPWPIWKPTVIFELSVSSKIGGSLDKEETMAGCEWSVLRKGWMFGHNSWNNTELLSWLGSGVTMTHDLIDHQCFTLKRPSCYKIVQTSFITLQNMYIGRYCTWQQNIHQNSQNKQGRGRISKATSTTEALWTISVGLCSRVFV